jgi:hypothetical protein
VAIQYVGGATEIAPGSTTTGATISLNGGLTGGIASSVSPGDLVIASICAGNSSSAFLYVIDNVPAAYPITIATLHSDDTNDVDLKVCAKLMGATPDTSVTFSPSGDAAAAIAVMVQVWRGVDLTTPFDVAAVPATGANTGRPDPSPITPTTAGAIIDVVGGSCSAIGAVFTSSDLSNFITRTSPDTYDAMIGGGSFAWSSGAFNPAQFGGGTTSTNDAWAAVTMALRPLQPITGSLAKTLANVTSTGSGQTTIEASADITIDAVTSAGAGQVSIEGAASITLDSVSLMAAGQEGLAIDASLILTLGDVTAAASGQTSIGATLDLALGSITLVATMQALVVVQTPPERTITVDSNVLSDRTINAT